MTFEGNNSYFKDLRVFLFPTALLRPFTTIILLIIVNLVQSYLVGYSKLSFTVLETYNDDFFEALNGVTNALDNVDASKYSTVPFLLRISSAKSVDIPQDILQEILRALPSVFSFTQSPHCCKRESRITTIVLVFSPSRKHSW